MIFFLRAFLFSQSKASGSACPKVQFCKTIIIPMFSLFYIKFVSCLNTSSSLCVHFQDPNYRLSLFYIQPVQGIQPINNYNYNGKAKMFVIFLLASDSSLKIRKNLKNAMILLKFKNFLGKKIFFLKLKRKTPSNIEFVEM